VETTEKVARARFKDLANIDPKLLCCEAMRANSQAVAGIEFDVFPERRWRERRACYECHFVHEVTAVQLVETIRNCTCVSVDFIDIDEGAA
jgi:hypothetical protein